MIPLTNRFSVKDGAHIAYFYHSQDAYIDTATSFIKTGIELGQHVIFLESEDNWLEVQRGLIDLEPEEFRNVNYVNNREFYQLHGEFVFERVLENLCSTVLPLISQGVRVRLWGHVDYEDHSPKQEEQVSAYEHSCDITVSELGFLTVCTYNARKVPTSVHFDMLRSHEYLMTDEKIVRSKLYLNSCNERTAVFPSLTVQERIESEVDLYKQKLDFVHVVSHEVRNPLTIIKAYAALLTKEELDPERLQKLNSMIDYCEIIDHELSHVIATEEVLSTDTLWNKRLVELNPILDEVLEIMGTKARTQNIDLVSQVNLPQGQICVGNQIGLKLIFSNIISNAVKYSYEGSQVEVSCEKLGDIFHFKVMDHGIGMSQQELSRLFRKYEKQNQEQTGQGIGLFMVKKLVDQLDGQIIVESSLGRGTCVNVHLPMLIDGSEDRILTLEQPYTRV